jgi:phenylacetate-CoA ligase
MGEFHRPDVQQLPRDALRALQEERLAAVLDRLASVPFWARKLSGAGVAPDDIKSLDDLARIPRTTKDELRASEAATPPLGDYRGAPMHASVRLSTSTGTTGRPTITLFTAHDLEVEYDAGGRMFHRQGRRAGEIVTHAHPGGLNGGQSLLGGVIEYFGCLNVPVGPPMSKADIDRAIDLWLELKPHHYELFGPVLHTFWEAAKARGLDPERDLNMKPPAEIPPYRTVSAGLDCFAFLGSACDQNDGAHVCEDEAIIEAVDDATGEPVPDGQRGNLVVTSLTKDNAMLRYDLQDVVRLDGGLCRCGETHVRAFWEGRRADIVRAAGKELLPNDVWRVLHAIPEVAEPELEFQMVRTSDTGTLRLRVESKDPSPALRARLNAMLEQELGAPVSVDIVETGALPRPSYKPLRVVDE